MNYRSLIIAICLALTFEAETGGAAGPDYLTEAESLAAKGQLKAAEIQLKNAVRSDILAACCILWVTMTMVTRFLSCPMSSSIFAVEMGSSALVGSSMSKTDGSAASARAICIAFLQARSTRSSSVLSPRMSK